VHVVFYWTLAPFSLLDITVSKESAASIFKIYGALCSSKTFILTYKAAGFHYTQDHNMSFYHFKDLTSCVTEMVVRERKNTHRWNHWLSLRT
jgi:hypothetical protein